MLAPGQRATLHLYDSSSLQVLRQARVQNDTFGQVVLDAAALEHRRFKLMSVGSILKILSWQPSTHTDKFGGTSSSIRAEVREEEAPQLPR